VLHHLSLRVFGPEHSDPARRLKDSLADCIAKPSVSVGVGFVYRFDPIRMEVNFGVPLVASASDNSRRGIQVGMGLEFL
jgi:outer membrane protein insertion porin family